MSTWKNDILLLVQEFYKMALKDNYENIISTIKETEKKFKRPANSVKLLAVSKTVSSDKIREMYHFGQRDFGENRPQILRDKIKELSDLEINWHFIGQLQSNKIKYVYPHATLVHSVDKTELLDEFIKFAIKTKHKCPCLLEVHISGEESKQGFECNEVLNIIKNYNNNPNLDIRGMMGMAPLEADENIVQQCFHNLKLLFDESKQFEGISYKAQVLSMGMSGDFKIAIEEGSTIVRIGTALFKE